jgi:alginate O-acetyltransferase complex protein AlgJ
MPPVVPSPIVALTAEPPSATAAPTPAARRRPWQRALVALFLCFLAAPVLDLALGLDPNPSPLKVEVPFPRPHLDRSLLRWPGALVFYLQSNMGFRGALVRLHGRFVWSVLGSSPAPQTVVRSDPWLFMRSERALDGFRRTDPFSAAELGAWRDVLEARRRWLAARGIRYLMVVAPDKETIYAEAVPPAITRGPGPSRLEQLGEELRAPGSQVPFLDLTATLQMRKPVARLYHYTDTHWNDLGALAGYQAITARLRDWFPELRTLLESDFNVAEVVTPGGDDARICGLQLDLREPQRQLTLRPDVRAPAHLADGAPLAFERLDVHGTQRFETRAPAGEIPSAVILRDSFGEGLLPTLALHFQRATWIWTYDFPAAAIAADQPAVVIQEMVERKLMTVTPGNPPELAAD